MKKLKDYYGILGISQDADLKEIKKAYNDYAFLYHPDRTAGLSDSARQKAEAKMKEVNEAYEILSHPDKRKKYDSEWLQEKAGTSESQQSSDSAAMKPRPRVEPSFISFKDVAPGKILIGSFIVYNDSGPFVNFYVDPPNPPLSWIRIVGAKSIDSGQFPLQVEIEVEGQGWGTTHSAVLKVRMDDQETEVKIQLQTKLESIRTNPPFQKTSTARSPSYQSVPKNQGDSRKQKLSNYVVLIAFALVIFVVVKINQSVSEPKVENAAAVSVQPATTQRLLSGGKKSPGTVTDIDGNVYKTIQIGTQVWMAENLKTTKYNDGTSIPLVTDATLWSGLTTSRYLWHENETATNPCYCWYDNDATTYKATYGALYNWYTINTGKLCPTGWHIPSDTEWTILINYMEDENVAGGKLKESGTVHWNSPNTGATNETGFTALPAGHRDGNGAFFDIKSRRIPGSTGYWWSSTGYATTGFAWLRCMTYDYNGVNKYLDHKHNGFCVRCLRDD